jgi:flagellar hook assembly protein FlgD
VNEINIQFNLQKNSKLVVLRVADFNGYVYKEIPLKNLNKGKQNYSLNISDLNKGQYVYTVEIDGKMSSGNFNKL